MDPMAGRVRWDGWSEVGGAVERRWKSWKNRRGENKRSIRTVGR